MCAVICVCLAWVMWVFVNQEIWSSKKFVCQAAVCEGTSFGTGPIERLVGEGSLKSSLSMFHGIFLISLRIL